MAPNPHENNNISSAGGVRYIPRFVPQNPSLWKGGPREREAQAFNTRGSTALPYFIVVPAYPVSRVLPFRGGSILLVALFVLQNPLPVFSAHSAHISRSSSPTKDVAVKMPSFSQNIASLFHFRTVQLILACVVLGLSMTAIRRTYIDEVGLAIATVRFASAVSYDASSVPHIKLTSSSGKEYYNMARRRSCCIKTQAIQPAQC